MSNICNKSTYGFTLVELLVVISILGVLAGVTISIINPVEQRKKAQDGIRLSNLEKMALGIEAYGNANGSYPLETAITTVDSDYRPTDPEVATFISTIPTEQPAGAAYTYKINSSSGGFGLIVFTQGSSATSGYCFKYHSDWGKIKKCPTQGGATMYRACRLSIYDSTGMGSTGCVDI
jgi:general secretion pathway protein G